MTETTAPPLRELQSLLATAYRQRERALAQIGGDLDGPGARDANTRRGRRFPSSLLTRKRLQAEGIGELLEQVHSLLVEANEL